MCQHPSLVVLDAGTDHRVLIHSNDDVRAILVRGFPAYYCSRCLEVLTDLSWELAVQHELERRINLGEDPGDLVLFADLHVEQPAVLCA